jgi:hypothetical protein
MTKIDKITEHFISLIQKQLGVPNDRIFIDFKDIERNLLGWNGKTF